MDNSFDGAIIDLKLADEGYEGNQVVSAIEKTFFRIPVAIFTATPGSADKNFTYIGIYKKGDIRYHDLFDQFLNIQTTGITHIMGGTGLIEQRLSEVFLNNLLPQIDTWVSHGKENSDRTERALLRYALNHLYQLLEEDNEHYFPEEFYLYPSVSEEITTGSIVKEEANDRHFVVLSPACDLVIRGNGIFKTDCILFIEIESENDIVNAALDGIRQNRKKKDKLKTISNNNHRDYYHWLPRTDFFEGGFLNFRKLNTLNKTCFDERFEKPSIQISPFFVKDIVSRFSSFYARQGQPDIDSKEFIARHTT